MQLKLTLTKETGNPIRNYHDCLKSIVCKTPTPDCYLDECHKCPDISIFSTTLLEILTSAFIDKI